MPAAAQKARQWYDELTTKADRGIACKALLGHRVDDRVERVRDSQVVGQVRSVQVAEEVWSRPGVKGPTGSIAVKGVS